MAAPLLFRPFGASTGLAQRVCVLTIRGIRLLNAEHLDQVPHFTPSLEDSTIKTLTSPRGGGRNSSMINHLSSSRKKVGPTFRKLVSSVISSRGFLAVVAHVRGCIFASMYFCLPAVVVYHKGIFLLRCFLNFGKFYLRPQLLSAFRTSFGWHLFTIPCT